MTRLLLLLLCSLPWTYTMSPVKLASRTGHVRYEASIPVLKGGPTAAAINKKLRAFVLPADVNSLEKDDPAFYRENPYTEEIDAEVTLLDDLYVSVQRTNLGMLQRAAHPNVSFAGMTLWLESGNVVKLSDLMQPGTEKKLYQKILKAGRREVPDVHIEDRQRWDWVMTPDGIRFLNLVPGHAAASFTVTLTWDELKDLRR